MVSDVNPLVKIEGGAVFIFGPMVFPSGTYRIQPPPRYRRRKLGPLGPCHNAGRFMNDCRSGHADEN